MLGKKFYGLVHGHLQNIVNILVLELHFQCVGLETLAMATFAFQYQISHELHFYCYCAFALAFLTTSSLGVEGEVAGSITQLFG